LSWKAREPKKIGKVRRRSKRPQFYGDIKEAIVTVTF
jgi:hypothetical protein